MRRWSSSASLPGFNWGATINAGFLNSQRAFRGWERDPIPYALETDWPVGAAGFEPLHFGSDRPVSVIA